MIRFEPQEYDSLPILKLAVFDNEKEIGFYLFVPQAIDIYEVHTHFEPEAFGSTVEISKQAVKKIFNLLPDMHVLITKVPVNNPLAKQLSTKVGMKQYGVLPQSFKVGDSWIDQELFIIYKEESCQ